MTSPNTIIADMQAEIDALRKERDELQAELIGIKQNIIIAATCNYIARMEQAEKQRDELLAALEAVNESAVCFAKNEYSISADAISKVEDAIAIVKSNQPC